VRISLITALAAISTSASAPLGAQGPPITKELRIDALVANHAAVEVGASVSVPGGVYARTAITAATGVAWRDGATMSATRVEMVSRFLLDPFRESPYGLSIGGGLGVTNAAGGPHWRPYLTSIIDLELARTGGVTPAIQLGLGGGARLGVVLRSGVDRWR
jgi:hypothetical protein